MNVVSSSCELLLDDSTILEEEQQQQSSCKIQKKKKLLELANIKKSSPANPIAAGGLKIAGGAAKGPLQQSKRERLWLYSTLFLSMITVATGTSLLFLVPLYVDPAISTLMADFTAEPVLCTTSRRDDYTGLFNCSWSSCREGCTSDMYRCTHIYVRYSTNRHFLTTASSSATATTSPSLSSSLVAQYRRIKREALLLLASSIVEHRNRYIRQTIRGGEEDDDDSHTEEAVFLVNIKGCGYPPSVRCANFTAKYGQLGASFPCYYSRQNRTVTMYRYDRTEHVRTIVHFFAIPFCLCIVSSCTLCVMHCDCCRLCQSFRRSVSSIDSRSRSRQGQQDDRYT